MNLCVNARDAMPQGGELSIFGTLKTLAASTSLSHLEAKAGSYVVIEVHDTGIGMEPAVLDRIFDPFFTTKAIGQGTGLGLSAVLGIVKSHGGLIDVHSQVGSGTTFQILLPAYTVDTRNIVEEGGFGSGNQETILVVDDEAAIRDVLQVTLETYNYRVLTASDGLEAIALCQNYPDPIHLVLIDLMMPRMDGFATIAALQPIRPQCRAIGMSGVSPPDIVHQAEAVGFQRFLTKPFSAQELLQALQFTLID